MPLLDPTVYAILDMGASASIGLGPTMAATTDAECSASFSTANLLVGAGPNGCSAVGNIQYPDAMPTGFRSHTPNVRASGTATARGQLLYIDPSGGAEILGGRDIAGRASARAALADLSIGASVQASTLKYDTSIVRDGQEFGGSLYLSLSAYAQAFAQDSLLFHIPDYYDHKDVVLPISFIFHGFIQDMRTGNAFDAGPGDQRLSHWGDRRHLSARIVPAGKAGR